MTMALILVLLIGMVAIHAPAEALQSTYTCPLPTDPSRTGVKIQRRDGPDTATWVTKATQPTCSFTDTGLVMATRYCYRAVTTGALGDGTPNTESCGTPDKPLSAGTGTLTITP
jgi:hypothetical protein